MSFSYSFYYLKIAFIPISHIINLQSDHKRNDIIPVKCFFCIEVVLGPNGILPHVNILCYFKVLKTKQCKSLSFHGRV